MLIFFLYSPLNESLSWFPGSAHCSHRPEDKGQVTIPVYAWHLRFSFLRYSHHTCWIQDMGIIYHDPYSPQHTQLPSVSVLTQLNFRGWHCQRQTLSPGFPPPTLLSPNLSCYFKDVFSEQLSMRAVLGSSHTPVLGQEWGDNIVSSTTSCFQCGKTCLWSLNQAGDSSASSAWHSSQKAQVRQLADSLTSHQIMTSDNSLWILIHQRSAHTFQ